MKKLTFVLALSLIVGCGAVQDWSGTYEGTSKRAASATELEAATAVKDIWKVTHNKNNGVIQILRESSSSSRARSRRSSAPRAPSHGTACIR